MTSQPEIAKQKTQRHRFSNPSPAEERKNQELWPFSVWRDTPSLSPPIDPKRLPEHLRHPPPSKLPDIEDKVFDAIAVAMVREGLTLPEMAQAIGRSQWFVLLLYV